MIKRQSSAELKAKMRREEEIKIKIGGTDTLNVKSEGQEKGRGLIKIGGTDTLNVQSEDQEKGRGVIKKEELIH